VLMVFLMRHLRKVHEGGTPSPALGTSALPGIFCRVHQCGYALIELLLTNI
jgi:hypothetical protein